jgi:NAD(P)-dependent dehydrogenase (short-subunit alcohol dehydrogenase family)
MISFDFSGKQVLVTGASRGIGFAIAEGFVASGADVTLLADDGAVGDSARALEDKYSLAVKGVQCDISDTPSVNESLGELGVIDILINNAGFERMTPVEDPDPEVAATFQRIMDINVVGTFDVTRAVLKQMPDGGSIVNTSSIWGKSAEAGFAAYCASKHAIIGLTRTLAKELGPRNIRVNAICPGWVRTEASMRSLEVMAERTGSDEQVLLDSITAAQALPGLMNPEDVVSAYLYLASAAAVNITGQALNVDRGEVMI